MTDPRTEPMRPSEPDAGMAATNADQVNEDLEARQALQRIDGLRTELEDVAEVEYRQLRLERVVLVSAWISGTREDLEVSVRELKLLAETAGVEVLDALVQRRSQPDPATYIGAGKVAEVSEVVQATGADTVIFDGELDAAQLRNLEDRIKVKVIDRTGLILDIFAQHAKSAEGKAQVEMAQLQYLRQRLRGWGGNLSRQAGGQAAGGAGIGGRGPGETKIETDRRRIQHRISILRRRLKEMEKTREGKRAQRQRHEMPSVAIVGYTNAGKSSLLNRLTSAGVLVQDALFATLDPTTRRTQTDDGREYTLTDTVGFVRHLPHDLVEAFRSTLEESAEADLLLHVVDAADRDPEGQISAVRKVLHEIGALHVPELLVFNKSDLADETTLLALRANHPDSLTVSARTGRGLDELKERLGKRLPAPEILIDAVVPWERGDLVDQIHRMGRIQTLEHTEAGTHVNALVGPALAEELAEFSHG